MHVGQTPFRVPAAHPRQAELGSASAHPPTRVTAAAEAVKWRTPLTRRTRTTSSGIILLRPLRWPVRTALPAEVPVRRGTVPHPTLAPETNLAPRSLRLLLRGLAQAMPGDKVSARLLHPRRMALWRTGRLRIWCPPSMGIH